MTVCPYCKPLPPMLPYDEAARLAAELAVHARDDARVIQNEIHAARKERDHHKNNVIEIFAIATKCDRHTAINRICVFRDSLPCACRQAVAERWPEYRDVT